MTHRHRLSKIENAVSIAQKESKERKKVWRYHARHHATAVAAIVLSGQPKIAEPLNRAWTRALQHYAIKVGESGGIDQARAAEQLLPMIIGKEEMSARFTEIFSTAPVWVLQFTGLTRDAHLLNFRLPDISRSRFIWGSLGYEDATRWPLLPLGTMAAGDPIANTDPRQLYIAYLGVVWPILDEDNPSQEKEEKNISRYDKHILEEFCFALDLDRKPEEEWTPHEKRRMRKVSKLVSRLESDSKPGKRASCRRG